MNNIYFIPPYLRCPECNKNLGSPLQLTTLNKIWCDYCKIMRKPKEFRKQFGMIKDVGEMK